MMKKRLIIFSSIFLIVLLTGCSKNSNPEFKESNININDIVIEIDKDDTGNMEIEIDNNTKYDIIGVTYNRVNRENLTTDELSLYSSFINSHKNLLNAGVKENDVMIMSIINGVIEKGDDEDSNLYLAYNNFHWTDPVNERQFNLTKEHSVELNFVDNEYILHSATYDYSTKKWTFGDTKKLNNWSNNSLAKTVKKPNVKYFIVEEDTEEIYSYIVYDFDYDDYKDYMKEIKKTYNKNTFSDTNVFEGADSKGNLLIAQYNEDYSEFIITKG